MSRRARVCALKGVIRGWGKEIPLSPFYKELFSAWIGAPRETPQAWFSSLCGVRLSSSDLRSAWLTLSASISVTFRLHCSARSQLSYSSHQGLLQYVKWQRYWSQSHPSFSRKLPKPCRTLFPLQYINRQKNWSIYSKEILIIKKKCGATITELKAEKIGDRWRKTAEINQPGEHIMNEKQLKTQLCSWVQSTVPVRMIFCQRTVVRTSTK